MNDLVKLEDVAKRANVSLATASYALNGSKKIRKETREKVVRAAEELGFIPNAMAQGLSGKKSNVIGLVIANIAMPYFAEILQNLEKEVRSRGYGVLLGISNDDVELEASIINNFRWSRVEGIIVTPRIVGASMASIKAPSVYHQLDTWGTPCVFVNAVYPDLNVSTVLPDLVAGTHELTTYLLEKGYRNIVFFTGLSSDYPSTQRYKGYCQAYKEANMVKPETSIIECGDYSFSSAYSCIQKHIEENPLPDVLMFSNDTMALGGIKALQENNIRVPQDVAVTGYDELIHPQVTDIELTTVHIPIRDMCITAVDILLNHIAEEESSPKHIYMAPELRVRCSTQKLETGR